MHARTVSCESNVEKKVFFFLIVLLRSCAQFQCQPKSDSCPRYKCVAVRCSDGAEPVIPVDSRGCSGRWFCVLANVVLTTTPACRLGCPKCRDDCSVADLAKCFTADSCRIKRGVFEPREVKSNPCCRGVCTGLLRDVTFVGDAKSDGTTADAEKTLRTA